MECNINIEGLEQQQMGCVESKLDARPSLNRSIFKII